MSESLSELLIRHTDHIVRTVRRHAGGLVRHETHEDLAQGVRLRVLDGASSFNWRGEGAFRAWLTTIAKNHLNDRRAYWRAARRDGGHFLRVSMAGGGSAAPGGVEPISSRTGPVTFADRRDQLDLATRAIETLLPRDREILALERSGVEPEDIATRLGLTASTAARARRRALERFRRSFELIARGG